MADKKDQVFITRMSERIKQALAKLAQGDGVSMAQYVEKLIERDLKRKGSKARATEKIS